jgi:hypothetical protein
MYVIGQCVGAIVGSGLLKGVTPSNYTGNLGATTLQHGMSGGKGFIFVESDVKHHDPNPHVLTANR